MARGKKTRKKKRPSKSSTATVTRKGRESVKRLQWSDDSMLAAMKNGSISINKAAVLHGVPRTTLKDRLSGKVLHGTKPGPKCYLTCNEEHDLAEYLVEAAAIGYGKTRRQVLSIAGQVAKEKGLLRKI